ncbi:MAG: hypothetical protein J6W69_01720, partial [Bacteroidales bacterium]|nr:hypothetical protein [Bacteroidales bacterium]
MELIYEQRNVTTAAPQLVQIAKMIEATDDELAQLITAESEKNPVLEVDYSVANGATGDNEPSGEEGNGSSGDDDGALANEPNETDESSQADTADERADRDPDDDDGEGDIGQNSEKSDYDPLINIRSEKSLTEDLLEQLNMMELTDEELYLARYLVNSLDNKGYLSRDLIDLVEDLELNEMHETTVEELEHVLVDIVQQLEPTGIAARDMRECLLLQL